MTRADIYHQTNKKPIKLTYQCMLENGLDEDDKFVITKVLRDFEKLIIVNQYNQMEIINPNQ